MNSKEIDTAMRKRVPVMFDGVRYDRIKEYVSWYTDNGEHKLSAVLIAGNSLCRVPADKVQIAEEG